MVEIPEDPTIEGIDSLEDQKRSKATILQGIKERYGEFNPVQAVINPHYYLEDREVGHWPERFGFVIFEKPKSLPIAPHKYPTTRPYINGYLYIPSWIEDSIHPELGDQSAFIVSSPRWYYEIAKAYGTTYPEIVRSLGKKGLDWDELTFFGENPGEIKVPHRVDYRHPQREMIKFVRFIDRLTRPQ